MTTRDNSYYDAIGKRDVTSRKNHACIGVFLCLPACSFVMF